MDGTMKLPDNVFQPVKPVAAAKPVADADGVLRPHSDRPVYANFESIHLCVGAGVAIFHLASKRVVLCYHTVGKYWFLPKGRRDANEETGPGAEREGFEESGYRNRLLPLPIKHRQPVPHNPSGEVSPFVTEPLWTQLVPQSPRSQYVLFWHVAETVPPDVEDELNAKTDAAATKSSKTPYQYPPKYPTGLKLEDRLKLEPEGYEPVHHSNTGVNDEELLYVSRLLPVDEALDKMKGTIQHAVIQEGWEAICLRYKLESSSN